MAMKHIKDNVMLLSLALCAVITMLASCSSNDDDSSVLPQIFIEQPFYSIAKGQVTINVETDVAPTQDIVIPVRFAGTAVRDVDFTTDEPQVTIKAGETKGSMTLSRVVDNIPDDNLELFINLAGAPAGYSLGLMNYASVNFLGKNGYVMSFKETTGTVGLDGEFKIVLYDMKGSIYRPKADEYFSIVIDEEQSTAVEGEHFELPEGNVIKYKSGAREGVLKVKMLKVEPGRDKIVFRFGDKDGFATGNNPVMTVTVKGPEIYNGTWQFDHFDLADVLMYGDWGTSIYPDLAPTGSEADKFTLTGDSYLKYTFTPQFAGDLKKYFGTASREVTFIKEDKEFRDQSGNFPLFTRLRFPGINYSFSNKQSDIRDAQVAFKLKMIDGKECLECWIGDWVPVDDEFGGELCYWIYDDTYLWGMAPIRVYFTRVP